MNFLDQQIIDASNYSIGLERIKKSDKKLFTKEDILWAFNDIETLLAWEKDTYEKLITWATESEKAGDIGAALEYRKVAVNRMQNIVNYEKELKDREANNGRK